MRKNYHRDLNVKSGHEMIFESKMKKMKEKTSLKIH